MSSIRATARRRSWPVLALAGLGLLAPAAHAADELAKGLAGTWRGAVTESTLETPLREVEVELEASGSDVIARWPTVDGSAQLVRLAPSERPGILAPAAGGLQAMLGNADVPNPLEGEPLLWARRDERAFYIYRLELAVDGRLTLDRYVFEPGPHPGRLAFSVTRSGAGGEKLGQARATLERQGR